eukprot:scaffold186425_cov21-Prasinocladus_malaysianus.AAC.2
MPQIIGFAVFDAMHNATTLAYSLVICLIIGAPHIARDRCALVAYFCLAIVTLRIGHLLVVSHSSRR